MKQSILTRLTNWLGQNIIGEISEIERRSGVKLRPDFYWPRGSIILPKATNIELVQRLAENEVRRRMSRATVLFCMAISLPVALFNTFTLPAFLIWTKTGITSAGYGARNISNFSTGCMFGRENDDSLLSCQRSLRSKSDVASNRVTNNSYSKEKYETSVKLFNFLKERAEAKRKNDSNWQAVREAEVNQLSKNFSESELSEFMTVAIEVNGYEVELRRIQAKLKANYYKEKAKNGGLTEEENAEYQSQIEIIKNEGGKQ